jgi:hypothetical protein
MITVVIPERSFPVPSTLVEILEEPPDDLEWAVVQAVMLCQATYTPMGKAITAAVAKWIKAHGRTGG